MKKEIIDRFEGKQNVFHIISDNGTESYLTQSRSFADEAYNLGATKLNTVENEKKHVLFLFDSNDMEVGRYYIGKKLQGQTPAQFVEQKDRLAFFETWNPESRSWVPCVGITNNNPLKEVASKAVSFNNDSFIKNSVKEFSRKIGETIGSQVTDHMGNTINRSVKMTKHLLLLQQILNNSLYSYKHPYDTSDLPSFMWNDEGLFMGSNSILPYTIPFLWIRNIAKKDGEKFNEVISLLNNEFGVDVSEEIDVVDIVQGIRKYGFRDYKPNFDVQVNKSLLSIFYGDCLSLDNFILLFGSNIDMSDLLPSQTDIVNIPAASLSLNKIINEMINDFRKGNLESK